MHSAGAPSLTMVNAIGSHGHAAGRAAAPPQAFRRARRQATGQGGYTARAPGEIIGQGVSRTRAADVGARAVPAAEVAGGREHVYGEDASAAAPG